MTSNLSVSQLALDFEVNFYGKDDPEVDIGSGFSGLELALRPR